MNRTDADDANDAGGSTESERNGSLGRAPDAAAVGDAVIESAVSDAAATTPTVAHATLEGGERATRPDRVSSILVAVGPGPHSGATVDLARRVADATDAWLELFHVVPSDAAIADDRPDSENAEAPSGSSDPGDSADTAGRTSPSALGEVSSDEYTVAGESLLSSARDRLGDFDRVDSWLVEDRTAAGAIVEQSPYYDLVVVGAPTTGTVGRFVFGSTTDTVVDDAEVPVVVVEADGSTELRTE
ncbi:universal stress protein [Halorubrum sp. DTA46]|uniref:universal stress protein n=1 Tax=Halorubrum sp. DTA46 TaxID=3402162 RepID=UPI003AAA214A